MARQLLLWFDWVWFFVFRYHLIIIAVEQQQTQSLPPVLPYFPERRAKWVRPKGPDGEELPKSKRPPPDPSRPKRERKPRPEPRPDDDPEKWGQYYFRDAILDQLETYFLYLRRMRHADRDSYELCSRLGIQIMPQSAINTFDEWRTKDGVDDLSAWWIETKPTFGAIAYGIDAAAKEEESILVVDTIESIKWKPQHAFKGRVATVTGTDYKPKVNGTTTDPKVGMIWVPKFLYFHKYDRTPPDIQRVMDATVYQMTVYWDRPQDRQSATYRKRHKGGSQQDYAVCIDNKTGHVQLLRQLLFKPIYLRHRAGKDRGMEFTIPQRRWTYGINEYLHWAQGRNDVSAEDYLRRLFIEAALMYETSAQGSMIRVEANKDGLTAAFGVEIKRTSYFFKDRDITLSVDGKRQRIFHIVRPHERQTKHGPKVVKLHFRGLKQFTWAGYEVKITVPGLDHLHLPEIDVGVTDLRQLKDHRNKLSMKQFAVKLRGWINEGVGGRKQ